MMILILIIAYLSIIHSEYIINDNNTSLLISTNLSTSTVYITNTYDSYENKINVPLSINKASSTQYNNKTKIKYYGPIPIVIVLSYNSITNIDSPGNLYNADFYMQTYWPDDSICHDEPSTCSFDALSMWTPNLEFFNKYGDISTSVASPYSIISPPISWISEIPELYNTYNNWGNYWVKCDQRYKGTFMSKMELSEFPFDSQVLIIQLQSYSFNSSEVKFYFPSSLSNKSLDINMAIDDWNLTSPAFAFNTYTYKHQLTGILHNRATFGVGIVRESSYYTFRLVSPIIFLVIMNFFSFQLNVADTGRMGTSICIMWLLIQILFVSGSVAPSITVPTRFSNFMIVASYLVFFSLIVHTLFYLFRYLPYFQSRPIEVKTEKENSEDTEMVNIQTQPAEINRGVERYVIRGNHKNVIMAGTLDNHSADKSVLVEALNKLGILRRLDLLFVIFGTVAYVSALAALYLKETTPVTILSRFY